jgi:hypothetical protein
MGAVILIGPGLMEIDFGLGLLFLQVFEHIAEEGFIGVLPAAVAAYLLGHKDIPGFFLQHFPDGYYYMEMQGNVKIFSYSINENINKNYY